MVSVKVAAYLAQRIVELLLQLGVSGPKGIDILDQTVEACDHIAEALLTWFI